MSGIKSTHRTKTPAKAKRKTSLILRSAESGRLTRLSNLPSAERRAAITEFVRYAK